MSKRRERDGSETDDETTILKGPHLLAVAKNWVRYTSEAQNDTTIGFMNHAVVMQFLELVLSASGNKVLQRLDGEIKVLLEDIPVGGRHPLPQFQAAIPLLRAAFAEPVVAEGKNPFDGPPVVTKVRGLSNVLLPFLQPFATAVLGRPWAEIEEYIDGFFASIGENPKQIPSELLNYVLNSYAWAHLRSLTSYYFEYTAPPVPGDAQLHIMLILPINTILVGNADRQESELQVNTRIRVAPSLQWIAIIMIYLVQKNWSALSNFCEKLDRAWALCQDSAQNAILQPWAKGVELVAGEDTFFCPIVPPRDTGGANALVLWSGPDGPAADDINVTVRFIKAELDAAKENGILDEEELSERVLSATQRLVCMYWAFVTFRTLVDYIHVNTQDNLALLKERIGLFSPRPLANSEVFADLFNNMTGLMEEVKERWKDHRKEGKTEPQAPERPSFAGLADFLQHVVTKV